MLIATAQAAYSLSLESGAINPRTEGPIACIAESDTADLVARKDGLIVVLTRGRLGQPGQTDDPYEIATGIHEPITSILQLPHPETVELLVGTEGAHLYRCLAGPGQRIEAFDELNCREQWYTPWGGPPAVRTLAATTDGHVYADIHVGSIMHSPDRGETWEPVTPELHVDVHEVATTRADDDLVAANTANGPWVSTDRGRSWQHRAGEPLNHRYGRAIALDPNDASRMLASVSDGPHGDHVHGQLYLSRDGGRSWKHVCQEFPESTPDNINTGRLAFSPDGRAWAAAGADLFAADRQDRWQRVHQFDGAIEKIAQFGG